MDKPLVGSSFKTIQKERPAANEPCNATATNRETAFMSARQHEGDDASTERDKEMERQDPRTKTVTEVERRPVTFTRDELWLLHDFVRHELPDSRQWRFPPASEELNEEIALALDACEGHGLEDYTLLLSRGDMLVIDFFVRRDHRTPEGASGKQLLLKIFRARSELSLELPEHEGNDLTYREVRRDAAADDHDSG